MANSATLSWTAPTTNADGTPLTNLAGYKVYYGTASRVYGAPIDVGLSVGNPPTYSVNNLGTGTFYFAVTAYDSVGLESSYSAEVTKTFATGGPLIAAVAAGNVSSSGAAITWTTDVASTSQVLYGTTTAYGAVTTLDSSLVTSHSQTLSGLLASTTYHYSVQSTDASGNLSSSADNIFTTSASIIPPVISAVTAGNITSSSAVITWTTNVGSTSQIVYGTTIAYGASTTLNSSLVTSHSQPLSGLQASTTYHYSVQSTDASGNLSSSADNTLTTATAITFPVISAVTAGNITSSSAVITWTTNVASSSQVEYGPTAAYGTLSTLNSTLSTAHSQSLSGLQASTTYHYRVRSADASGNLSMSGDNTLTTSTSVTAPVISAISVALITSTSGTVTWTTDVASTSQIDYGTTTAYGSSTTLTSSLVTNHSQTLSGLQPSTTYHYRVRSADGSGDLSISGDNTFTTSASPGTVGGPAPIPPGPSGGSNSPSASSTPTSLTGGCGLVSPRDGKTANPGEAADMFAILGVILVALLRKGFCRTNKSTGCSTQRPFRATRKTVSAIIM